MAHDDVEDSTCVGRRRRGVEAIVRDNDNLALRESRWRHLEPKWLETPCTMIPDAHPVHENLHTRQDSSQNTVSD